jgi:hypothetical protein
MLCLGSFLARAGHPVLERHLPAGIHKQYPVHHVTTLARFSMGCITTPSPPHFHPPTLLLDEAEVVRIEYLRQELRVGLVGPCTKLLGVDFFRDAMEQRRAEPLVVVS